MVNVLILICIGKNSFKESRLQKFKKKDFFWHRVSVHISMFFYATGVCRDRGLSIKKLI